MFLYYNIYSLCHIRIIQTSKLSFTLSLCTYICIKLNLKFGDGIKYNELLID